MKGLANTDCEIWKTRVWTWHFCLGSKSEHGHHCATSSLASPYSFQFCHTCLQAYADLPHVVPELINLLWQISRSRYTFLRVWSERISISVRGTGQLITRCVIVVSCLIVVWRIPLIRLMRLFSLAFLPILSNSTPVVLTCFTLFQNSSSQLGR